ncbi:MAG TPA: winged helix-turn-helix transcriptional regulator [Thermoplasmata archaeon]|nr:winged helix-turn-helix transcriptional regulator [Thermoplasmata archaeon]
MDALDYAIYRYLSSDGLIRFWGARRLVDPLVSARGIADKVGLSEAGVRVRLKGLEQQGYVRGRETGVNPSLFGVSLVVAEVPVQEPHDAERMLRELALVDGVTFARDVLDEKDRAIRVYYVSDTPTATARRTALLRKLAPTPEVRGPAPYWIPACERELTRLDWRLLAAFRAHPQATRSELAHTTGISLKTAAARFRRLLESKACWSTLSSASEELPLALFSVTVREKGDPLGVARAVAGLLPGWMPVAPDGSGVSPSEAAREVAGLVPSESPAALEHALRRTLTVEGVTNVRRTFALGSATFPQWFDDRLSAQMKAIV